MPTTALLIPCYNAERYLPALQRQIEAIHPKFDEVILVDDGSTDRTVKKGRELGLKIEPLGTNRGPGAARNAAAKRSKAEWIHFFDADDEISPEYLSKVLPLATKETDVVLSSCDYVDEASGILQMRWEYKEKPFRENPIRATVAHQVVLHSTLIRKSVFEKCKGFNEEMNCWEDADLHVRLACCGARFRVISEVLARSPRHRRGASKSNLYCHQCRLEFLKEYAGLVPRLPAKDLTDQLILTATRLFMEGDKQNCDKALDLALRHGWLGPESNHLLMKALSRIPSQKWRKTLFFMQMRARGAHKKREFSY